MNIDISHGSMRPLSVFSIPNNIAMEEAMNRRKYIIKTDPHNFIAKKKKRKIHNIL
jgi:hypothetical protein